MLITLIFSRFFHSNFIIQYLLFILVLFYCTTLLYVIWAVVSAVVAFLTLGTHVFIVHILFFCIFWHCLVLCFQNKLMMMMILTVQWDGVQGVGQTSRDSAATVCRVRCGTCTELPTVAHVYLRHCPATPWFTWPVSTVTCFTNIKHIS